MMRWLREPLLHFLVLGLALFVVNGYMNRGRSGVEPSRQIALTLDDLRQLTLYFESQWRRPPTPEEFGHLVEDKVREEVLYREGLAMGLDKDDTIVKRRLAQKLQFLAEDVAAAHEPDSAELKAWYDRHRDEFALPGRITFRQLYFSPDSRGAHVRADAEATLAKLARQPIDAPIAGSLGDSFMLQDYYGDRTSTQLAKDFGPAFAQAVFQLKPGSWQGPVESGFGWHLVFVDSFVPGRSPDFEEVEPDVKTAWLSQQKAEAWQKAYDAMRAKYAVLLPAPPAGESAPPASPPATDIPAPSGEGPS
ncbi:MAG TPA: peptidylprolyl isomerase [Candidatus Eisenbacteria bacterium]|nr:peptidylprolyl isomerase [Candidatus Eisenbacteria bacterium]